MPRPSPPAPPRHSEPDAWSGRLALVACALLALWVHRRSLGVYFSPDDLISIERVRGLVSAQAVPLWRALSGSGYFRVMLATWGAQPVAFHAVNLTLHAVNVVLLGLLIVRWGGTWFAAVLAAGLLATSRSFASALLQAVGIGELLSLCLLLLALHALAREPKAPWRVAAALLFAAALLAKESVLLIPAVLLVPAWPAARERRIDAAVLLAVSAAYAIVFLVLGGRGGAFGGAAYQTRWGANVLVNLATYGAWIIDLRHTLPDLGGAAMRGAVPAGAAMVAGAMLLAWFAWRRTRLGVVGVAWFLLGLAPVLPLVHHSFLQYAYAAFAGLAMLAGAIVERLASRWAGRDPAAESARRDSFLRVGWTLTLALLVAHTAVSDQLLARRFSERIPSGLLPRDPMLRKSGMAGSLIQSLGRTITLPHSRVAFIIPRETVNTLGSVSGRLGQVDSSQTVALLLDAVVDHGRAVRAVMPNVDSVAFLDRWGPGFRDFDVFVTSASGYCVNLGRGPEAHLQLIEALLRHGLVAPARDDLDSALVAYPNDPRLASLRAGLRESPPSH